MTYQTRAVKMEAIYKKLYDKYHQLKTEKDAEIEKSNREQEVKFINFVDAADEMIDILKKENARLHGQVDELVSSLRSSNKEIIDCKKLLEEEKQKRRNLLCTNKDLSDEIVKLQKLQQNDCPLPTLHEESGSGQGNSRKDTLTSEVPSESIRRSMKKRKSSQNKSVDTTFVRMEHDYNADLSVNDDKPAGCQMKICISGDDSRDTSANCVFQHLAELVIGMEFMPVPLAESKDPCILAHHLSSGYSFSLTWITFEGESSLLYRVESLGTFERLAPDWIKDPKILQAEMRSLFFAKVSGFINS